MEHSVGLTPGLDRGEDGKNWNLFSCHRNRNRHDRSFVQCLQELNGKRALLDAFLQDTDSYVLSRGVQEAKRILCKGSGQTDTQRQPIRAWVECRRVVAGNDLASPEWLLPDELSRFIRERVSSCSFSNRRAS
jgi:hypothetical protein